MARELIFSVTKKDFDISFFSGTGAGGQHRNKHQNCVRMVHRESGAAATGQSGKSRQQNMREAFKAIISSETFKTWHRIETSVQLATGASVRKRVRQMVAPENLRVEHGPFK